MVNMSWVLYGNAWASSMKPSSWFKTPTGLTPERYRSLIVEYAFWTGLGDYQKAQGVYQQMEALDAEHHWLPSAKAWSNIRQGRYAAAKEEGLFLRKTSIVLSVQDRAMGILARSGDYEQARETLAQS